MTSEKDRRAGSDRRQLEVGPPAGWKDRRRRTERRIPEIDECTVSESEWELYFGNAKPAKAGAHRSPDDETAADVFNRARD